MIIYYLVFATILICYLFEYYVVNFQKIALIFLFFILSFFAGLRAIDVSRDGLNYAYMFDSVSQYSDWFSSRNELMAVVIPVTLKKLEIYSYISAFLTFALIGVGLKLLAIKKYSPLPLLSVLLYYSNFFILHEMTQIRAGIATGILLLTIDDIYQKKFGKFLFKIFAASLFHFSSLAFLPIFFVNPKKINRLVYFIVLIVAILLGLAKGINVFKLIPGLSNLNSKLAMYDALQNQMVEVNLFNVTMLINIFAISLQLLFIKRVKSISKYSIIIIKIMFFGVVSLYVFSSIPVIAWRVSELFLTISFINLTYLYYIIRPRFISNTIVILIALLMIFLGLFRQGLLQPYHTLLS